MKKIGSLVVHVGEKVEFSDEMFNHDIQVCSYHLSGKIQYRCSVGLRGEYGTLIKEKSVPGFSSIENAKTYGKRLAETGLQNVEFEFGLDFSGRLQ